ncbi:MAG: hypothetical protein OEW75_08540 [Cyclobacteriaceae bacterium]|nr:hypothetical protein [Cyclobacteriaceae bacterium]
MALVTWFILTSIERQLKDENIDTAKEKTTYGLVSERNVYGV